MNSREKILNRISEALKNKSELQHVNPEAGKEIGVSLSSITPRTNTLLWEQFKEELEKIAGEYKNCTSDDEAVNFILAILGGLKIKAVSGDEMPLTCRITEKLIEQNIAVVHASSYGYGERKKIISGINCAVVSPTSAVADIGSLVFMMDDAKTSYPHFLCDNTIAVIKKENIVSSQFELFKKADAEKTKNMFFITGPSRTADIEKVLVLGAHGPRRLIVISID